MKKIIISIIAIIVLLLGALLILPSFFKGDIIRIIQNQSSKHIKAEVVIGDISLSMFKNFPDLNVAIKNVTISGKDEFANDTIVHIPLFEASVNLKSLVSGNEVIVNRILLQNASLAPTVSTSGKANWDILIQNETSANPESTETNAETQKTDEEKGLRLNDISIQNLRITYNDYHHSTYASIADIDLQLSGNFSESNTLIQVLLTLENISYRDGNSVWVNNTNLNWQSEIAANLKDKIFDLRQNTLSINDLKLDLTGGIALQGDKCNVNLKLNAPDTKFESLLALVPSTFRKHIEGLKTSGDFDLTVIANGDLYENHLPALDARLKVNNANLQYPELPEAIQKINIDLRITNPGGPIDSTLVDLKKLSFDIANNPFNLFIRIANLNDPLLNGGAVGVINFSNLKKALPLKDVTLKGILTTDVTFNGKYQYIEKEQYEKFTAKGSIVLKDILFVNADFPKGISVPQGSIIITPAKLNLNNLQAKIWSSDFTLQGSLSNYLPYIFKNETLKGNFSLTSNLINLNEFIVASTQSKKDSTQIKTDSLQQNIAKSSASEGALEIPRNIDIQFATNINSILFDQLSINNVKGNVKLAEATATLSTLSMSLLNGSMVMNGKYSTANPKVPTIDLGVNVSDFDINAVYQSFSFIRKSLPITMNCNGKISSSMKLAATLDKEMSIIMNTANGNGFVESKGILINDNPAMNQLASVLKNDELNRLSISSLKINFKIENGNIIIEPFKTTLAGNPVTIYGNQTVDGNLDYTLSMNVNRKFFGKDINNLLGAIPGSNNINNLDIDAKVSGTLSKPVIKPDLSKAINTVRKEAEKELKNKAKDGILKGLEKLFK